MKVVDASILIGLIRMEADVLERASLVFGPEACVIGAPTLVEARLWCAHRMAGGESELIEALARAPHVTVAPFDRAMADAAQEAYRRFGRTSGHAASLNFGDALAYATARALDLPLLYKGADFGLTDITIHPRSIRL